MNPIDLDALDPGIRRTVAWLRSLGYDTSDSGDGKTKVGSMECALDFPHVAIRLQFSHDLASTANELWSDLGKAGITVESGMIVASYDPADSSVVILLSGIDDEMLPAKLRAHPSHRFWHAHRRGADGRGLRRLRLSAR